MGSYSYKPSRFHKMFALWSRHVKSVLEREKNVIYLISSYDVTNSIGLLS